MAEASCSHNLICSVCQEILKDPVTIPCGHSYCMNCIEQWWDQDHRVYSCPQCRENFPSRPALCRNVTIAELVENLRTTLMFNQTAHCYAGAGDVECDVCPGRKCKAVKSCLECMKSYCHTHLEQHDIFFQGNKHKLMDPTGRIHTMICSYHKKPLEIYCCTDQQCICYPCTMEGHKNHETKKVVTARNEKQWQLKGMQRTLQQKIEEKENELQELRKMKESHMHYAQKAIKDCESIFTELIHSIKRCCFDVTQLIRDQEKAAVSQGERLQEQLHQDIDDLRIRCIKLQQLSSLDNDIYFLQSLGSVFAAVKSTVTHNSFVTSLVSFDDLRKEVSRLKEKLENFCKDEIEMISDRVTYITYIRPNKPITREQILLYISQFTMDPNSVNHHLFLSDGNRRATSTDVYQQYLYHPERFEYCAQVLCKESVSERCYWEVEWTGNEGVYISVAYKTISRKSDQDESLFGHNNQSWGVYCRPSSNFCQIGSSTPTTYSGPFQALVRQTPWTFCQSVRNNNLAHRPVSSSCPRIGVYVDHSAGTLSFYSVSDTMTLIHRVQTTFTQPLYPGFTVYKGSAVQVVH